jgi:hypothetical protein
MRTPLEAHLGRELVSPPKLKLERKPLSETLFLIKSAGGQWPRYWLSLLHTNTVEKGGCHLK